MKLALERYTSATGCQMATGYQMLMQANAKPAAVPGGGALQSEDQPALIKMTNQCKLNHDMPVRLPQKAAAQVPCGAAACSKTSARPEVAPLEPRRVRGGLRCHPILHCQPRDLRRKPSRPILHSKPDLRCQLSRPVPCAASPYTCTIKPSRPADQPILHSEPASLTCAANPAGLAASLYLHHKAQPAYPARRTCQPDLRCHLPILHSQSPRNSTCRRRSTPHASARSSSSASPPPSMPPSSRTSPSPAWRASWRRPSTPSRARRSGCRCSWPPSGIPPLQPACSISKRSNRKGPAMIRPS